MLYKSPVWRLTFRKLLRQVRMRAVRTLTHTTEQTPRTTGAMEADVEQHNFLTNVVKMQDVRVRMIFRGEAAETVEQVVWARREIWGGRSGRGYSAPLAVDY